MPWIKPGYKYFLIIGLFFFLNIYLLYNTASNVRTDEEARTLPRSGNFEKKTVFEKCEITDELAISALKRAKTEECRMKIEEAACNLKNNKFHDTFPESQCPNHDSLLSNFRVGCFVDQKSPRLLKEFEYKFKNGNSRETCRRHCYRAGFLYYGLEYGEECFCGNNLLNSTSLPDEKCKIYKCPGNDAEFCGGFNAIEVFRTGYKNQFVAKKPKYIENSAGIEKKAKILFLLQLNGRNERQVKRFIKSIYTPEHYYYVHVDKRQNYMYEEMKSLSKLVKNLYVSETKFSTIWGGASLLQMFQQIIRDTLENAGINDWDYIVNFSESDFPILPIEDFENLISLNMGYSFLASHGYNTARFIQKQGFEYVFLECEERMWRIGKRDFPGNLRIDGGSDWVGIHRKLAEYSISDEELPRKLRKLYESVLLPLESFYHTLSMNSKFCDNVMSSNLRLTNWVRKQGCRCAGLKKVVDWCGCSPLVFRNETVAKFDLEKVLAKPQYFGRKFDSMVDIDAIGLAELQSVRKTAILVEHPSYRSAFANVFKVGIDKDVKENQFSDENLSNLAESLFIISGADAKFVKLLRIDAFKSSPDANLQIVLQIESNLGIYEILVDRMNHFEIFEHSDVGGFVLKNITFGTKFEYKEEMCRDYVGMVTDKSNIQIRSQWAPTGLKPIQKNMEKTSPEVKIRFNSGDGMEILAKNLSPYDSIFGGQFGEMDLKIAKIDDSSNCEEFSADIQTIDDQKLGTIKFPVFPLKNPKCHLKLTRRFFEIIDFCVGEKSCGGRIWSTSYEDPKSDILNGYDVERKILS